MRNYVKGLKLLKNRQPYLLMLGLLCMIWGGASSDSLADQVVVETYFPTPLGSYQTIRLMPEVNVVGLPCDASLEGLVMFDSAGELKVCKGGAGWGGLTGGVWSQTGDNLYLADTVTIPDMRVGIGTTQPADYLDIHSASGISGMRISEQSGGGSIWEVQAHRTSGVESFVLHGGDNVSQSNIFDISRNHDIGFGTNDPQAAMHFYRDSGVNHGNFMIFPPVGSYGDLFIGFDGGSDTEFSFLLDDSTGTGGIVFEYYDGVNPSVPRLTLNSNGFSGIGTTNPLTHLHVMEDDGMAQVKIRNTSGATDSEWEMRAHDIGGGLDDGFTIWGGDRGAEKLRMFINTDGRVGFATTDLSGDLVIGDHGDIALTNETETFVRIDFEIPGVGLKDYAIKADDNVVSFGESVGDDGPPYNYDIVFSNNEPYLSMVGSAYKGAGGDVWGISSDRRLKKNIRPLDNALASLLDLKGVWFEWIDSSTHGGATGPRMGMIAQDVEKVFPDWVYEGKDGYKILDVVGFEALTVEALKGLDGQIESLEDNAEDLMQRLEALEAENAPQ